MTVSLPAWSPSILYYHSTHKPPLPLFTEAKATMPPRIKKCYGNAGRWLQTGVRAWRR